MKQLNAHCARITLNYFDTMIQYICGSRPYRAQQGVAD